MMSLAARLRWSIPSRNLFHAKIHMPPFTAVPKRIQSFARGTVPHTTLVYFFIISLMYHCDLIGVLMLMRTAYSTPVEEVSAQAVAPKGKAKRRRQPVGPWVAILLFLTAFGCAAVVFENERKRKKKGEPWSSLNPLVAWFTVVQNGSKGKLRPMVRYVLRQGIWSVTSSTGCSGRALHACGPFRQASL